MVKKYNILNDKDEIRRILTELKGFCDSHKNCVYCPFFDSTFDYCKVSIDKLSPIPAEFDLGDED